MQSCLTSEHQTQASEIRLRIRTNKCLTNGPGTAGVGASLVFFLAKKNPAKIYFTGRDQKRADAVISRVKKAVPDAVVVFLKTDLASLASVKAAAEQVTEDRLDLLICVAGIMATPPALTKDGYEMQFGVNYLSHALLFKLLRPKLLATAELPDSDVRVIITTSIGYRSANKKGILFDTLKTTQDTGAFAPWMRYGQSKLADLLLARNIAERYPKITSLAIHPGVVKTGLVSTLPPGAKAVVHVGCFLSGIKMIEPDEGCYNNLWAAAGDLKGVINGEMYEPVGQLTKTHSKPRSDPKLAGRLWEWTEEALEAY